MYEILDKYPRDHVLPCVPVQAYVLVSLEVCVADHNGESLLVVYPSYRMPAGDTPGASAENCDGFWTPPFVALNVELGISRPETVGDVFDLFSRYNDSFLENEATRLAYLMGFTGPKLAYRGHITELKRSGRTPEHTKCYRTHRFGVERLGRLGRRNLADPECRKGYVYLPLPNISESFKERYSYEHGRSQSYYLGKPIATNLASLLVNKAELENIRATAVSLNNSDFVYEEEGILVSMDLAGYGRAAEYAKDNMHSFAEDGGHAATRMRRTVNELFYAVVNSLETTQMQIAGDGLVFAVARRYFRDRSMESALNDILHSYVWTVRGLEIMNACIRSSGSRLGSRIAISYGRYNWGRISGTTSQRADFDGDDVIGVVRLESAVREWGASSGTECPMLDVGRIAEGQDQSSWRHRLVVSEELYGDVSQVFVGNGNLVALGKLHVTEKERQVRGVVFGVGNFGS